MALPSPQNLSEVLARKAAARKELARLPWGEKVRIVEEMGRSLHGWAGAGKRVWREIATDEWMLAQGFRPMTPDQEAAMRQRDAEHDAEEAEYAQKKAAAAGMTVPEWVRAEIERVRRQRPFFVPEEASGRD